MAPVTIAVGFKADGTAVNLYTGFNSLEALEKLDAAGAAKSIVEGAIFHGAPFRVRKYTEGAAQDDAASVDEHARMARLNELKKLTHEEVAELANKLSLTVDGKPVDDKFVKKSMANRMNMIVRIYDRQEANRPAKKNSIAMEKVKPESLASPEADAPVDQPSGDAPKPKGLGSK